ncbi:MAG: M13 family metallopeptidase [Deltaproteobacteria bacterium]|nr:M13 family metallopeptidase [Deltaproteobacteria bacterium]MBI3294077.1 M13 family metallopeptidase [Deltaproteobacteria bacterium]
MRFILILSLIVMSPFALARHRKAKAPKPANNLGVDVAAMDRTVKACDDFYQFACGEWIRKTEIPAGYSRWTRSFNVLNDNNLATLRAVLEKYGEGKLEPKVKDAEKLGGYYASCSKLEQAEKGDKQVLPGLLAEVEKIQSKDELFTSLGSWQKQGVGGFFGFGSEQDAKNSTMMIGVIDRGGMGLPEREYYLDPSAEKEKLRGLYVAHVAKMLTLAGTPEKPASEQAAIIMKIETALATHALKKEDRRDPNKVYHLIGVSGLKELSAPVPWDRFFAAIGQDNLKGLNVSEPEFFRALGTLINETDLAALKTYMRWHIIHSVGAYLGKRFVDEDFNFYGKALKGKKEQLPRWKTCVEATTAALGEALGAAFVQLKFAGDSKAEAQRLIGNIRAALETDFDQLSWMDDATRKKAKEKLATIVSKMGYPDQFRDYSKVVIDRALFVKNELSARAFEWERGLKKIGKPVDRAEWFMPPHMVNAYYNPNLNEIVFPAGILQTPFFHFAAPLASNYGGIGMVIGHEITHGFDDQGRQYDAEGNLKDWWTPQSSQAFDEKKACLVKQYDGFTVAGDVHLSGAFTLGENIADLGGLKLAHAAYLLARKGTKPAGTVSGLTEEQQFFVSFAQGWCTKSTPEDERMRAAVDPHANPRFRVNGVVPNMPQFQTAFSCQSGQPMAPGKHCAIW